MKAMEKKLLQRERRKLRIRKRVLGTAERPRLTVFRSHKNIYAQIIDDTASKTLVAASTMEKTLHQQVPVGGNRQAAQAVGAALAAKAAEAGITKVVFDRNGYLYHGRIKELADAARKGGLQF